MSFDMDNYQDLVNADDKVLLLMALLCRLGERVTLTYQEVEDIRRGRYGIQWSRNSSLNDDTFTLELIGGPYD